MKTYLPLDQELRSHVETACAAFHMNRQVQTMRSWACRAGPISPIRVNRRLMWPVDAMRRLLNGEGSAAK